MKQKITRAVIPAAGLGTRFLPATKSTPKEMLPIVDTPVIQFVLEEAEQSGITDVLIITGRGKRSIEDHFDHAPGLEAHLQERGKGELASVVRKIGSGLNIHFVRQKEQRGLGDAIMLSRSFVGNEPFALLLGDTIIKPSEALGIHGLQEMLMVFERYQCSVVSVRHVARELISRYGIVAVEEVADSLAELYRVTGLVEKPTPGTAPSDLAIAGRYLFTPDIFTYLEDLKPGVDGEVQLTDAMDQLAREHSLNALAWQAVRYDIGNKADYVRCFLDYASVHPETKGAVTDWVKGQS